MDKRKKQPKREIEVDFSEVETVQGVRVPPGWWRMKNGRFIEISKMSLSHLQAALSVLQARNDVHGDKYRELAADLDRREMSIVQGVVDRMRREMADLTPTQTMMSRLRTGTFNAMARNAPDPDQRVASPRFYSSQNPFINFDDLNFDPPPTQKKAMEPPKPAKKRKIRREKK